MNINELRIGNWVHHRPLGKPWQKSEPYLYEISNEDFYLDSTTVQDDLSPIPLTAQWLERFGFGVSLESNFGAVETSYCYAIENNGSIFELSEDFYFSAYDKADTGKPKTPMIQVKVETVHHLQNLFFALTGQELNEKEI